MKKIFTCMLVLLMGFGVTSVEAQTFDRESLLDDLKTIDPGIVNYFPRWEICERDLQIQVRQAFAVNGFPEASLDQNKIVVTAAPKGQDDLDPFFTLLLIECGSARMVASEIDVYMERLATILSGEYYYTGPYRGEETANGERDYCYRDIPQEDPLTQAQVEAITSYLEPSNVAHAFTLSAFNQGVKIGSSGFWLRSSIGTDKIGYHFWSSGEARVSLARPLYENEDPVTRKAIPYMINTHLGFAYRMTGGLDNDDNLLDFLPSRKLNAGPGGKFVAGLDFHMPFHKQAGISINLELPTKTLRKENVDPDTYVQYDPFTFVRADNPAATVDKIVPLLQSTGQVTFFYNWWINPKHPENYFRFDVGVSYAEVREAAILTEFDEEQNQLPPQIAVDGVSGLQLYKNSEAADWIYAKVEYRNQAAFPFGASLQYSNQILLARAYLPLLGSWLYLEGKFSTPLRDVRYYEEENFFMVSPVLRLTI